MEREKLPTVSAEKYNSLIEAYKKTRTENGVLKKALLREQEKATEFMCNPRLLQQQHL